MKDLKISFSLDDSKFMTAVRLAVGGVCAVADLDVDAAEDFKVCVTESCLILKNCGFKSAEVVLRVSDGVCAEINGYEAETPSEGQNELSLALISALVDCKIEKCGNVINKVTLKI